MAVIASSLPSLKSYPSYSIIRSGEEEKGYDTVRFGETGRRSHQNLEAFHRKIAAGIGPGCILPFVVGQGSDHSLDWSAIQLVSAVVLRNGRAFQGLQVPGGMVRCWDRTAVRVQDIITGRPPQKRSQTKVTNQCSRTQSRIRRLHGKLTSLRNLSAPPLVREGLK